MSLFTSEDTTNETANNILLAKLNDVTPKIKNDIATAIQSGKIVIVNTNNTTEPVRKSLKDFLTGVTFNHGTIKDIDDNVWLATSNNVTINDIDTSEPKVFEADIVEPND